MQKSIILAESIGVKYYLYKKYIKKKNKINSILKNRKMFGEFYHLYSELRDNENLFHAYTRMSTITFDYIVESIKPEFNLKSTNFQDPISVEERLLVTLR